MASNDRQIVWKPNLRRYFKEIYGKRHGMEALSLLEKLAESGVCIASQCSQGQGKGEI
jgi:hypothetical protein